MVWQIITAYHNAFQSIHDKLISIFNIESITWQQSAISHILLKKKLMLKVYKDLIKCTVSNWILTMTSVTKNILWYWVSILIALLLIGRKPVGLFQGTKTIVSNHLTTSNRANPRSYSTLSGASSRCLLNTDRYGTTTTSLGSHFHIQPPSEYWNSSLYLTRTFFFFINLF